MTGLSGRWWQVLNVEDWWCIGRCLLLCERVDLRLRTYALLVVV